MAPSLWNHIDFILQFDFMIAHIPGKANQASDYLSRIITDPDNQLKMTINGRIPTYDIVIDGIQPDLPSTDATPIDPDTVDEEMISSLMSLWQGSTNANAKDKDDILDAIVRICDKKEMTVTCLYNLTTTGRSKNFSALQTADPKREWYRDNTPLVMEAEQMKDNNIVQIKECIKRQTDINLDHAPTRLRNFVKQLPRLTVQNNVLYRKLFEHNGDFHLQTVIPEHLEQELPCRIHDQLQHAGVQK